MRRYLSALRRHPGTPIAAVLTVLGFFAGYGRPGMAPLYGGLFGAAVMSVFWIPVLATAWSNR